LRKVDVEPTSPIGNIGLIVSKLAFGAMAFGNDPSVPAIYKVGQEKEINSD
jgi:aryl-alcohol dehydrogenase-like predicted oxidoreductase